MTKITSTPPQLSPSTSPHAGTSWLPLPLWVLAAGCWLCLISWTGLLLSKADPDNAVMWLANGAVLAILLATPRREWPWYIAVNVIANFLAHAAFHYSAFASLLFSMLNTVEVLIAAVLLARKVKGVPDLSHPATLAQFGLFCVVVAPASSAILAGAVSASLAHVPPLSFIRNWFVADALGVALMTPLILAIRPDQLREVALENKTLEAVALLSVLAATGVAVFSESRYPVVFLIYPVLLVVIFRLGRAASAIAICLLAIPAIHFTLLSRGPFSIPASGSLTTQIILLQIFFFTLVLMMYGVTATLSERKRLSNDLRDSEERYRILADHSWDIIMRTDLEGRRSYLSPSVLDVVGWTPEELIGRVSTDLIHPEDQQHHKLMWKELVTNNARLVYTYRMKTKGGSYLWVEAKSRLVTDRATGLPREVVSVIRDVSARVAEQQQLMLAYRQAQVLAKMDVLTGLANRRGFDESLKGEWRRATRDQTQLSLLMVDFDDFKSYNDAYGHPAGDACLQAVADTLTKSLQRASDIAARYGGEEFAILLPNTPAAGAKETAERIRLAVAELNLDPDGHVARLSTVSIGVATVRPVRDRKQDELVSTADQALYTAKRNGKNQVVSWLPTDAIEPGAQPENGSA